MVRLSLIVGQLAAVSSAVVMAAPTARPERLARNIWVQEELRQAVFDAWDTSPTFREQVRAIEERRDVHVAITLEPRAASDTACRAVCELRKYSSGLLFARIVLPGLRDATELVAHELEHVRERAENIDLPKAIALRTPGVWQLPDGRFETQRARGMGLRVKDEVARAQQTLLTQASPTPTRP